VTIVLGSIDKRDKRNPFPFHDRKKMIKNVYSDPELGTPTPWTQQLVVLGVPDISDDLGWSRYILRSVEDHWVDNRGIKEENYIKPDAYYTGSEFDARWYRDSGMETNIISRIDKKFPVTTATLVRDLCEYGDDRWKSYVPEEAHSTIGKWVSRVQFMAHEQ
jgi:nicotinamide mononucleotide adenylyltransferase